MLTVTDTNQCIDSISKQVIMYYDFLLHMPTAFTPNADGNNDTFGPTGLRMSKYKAYDFYIYNRWGEIIFQTDDINDFWDGLDSPSGLYNWLLIITDELGAQGTVLAGGRYDGLSKILGGVEVAGVGWAAGIERLSLMVQSEYINSPDIVLMAQTEFYNHLLLPIMNKLVNQDFKVEIIYTGNMSKKFKRANKINASYAILLGEEEVVKKVIKLKNLSSGSEQLIDLNQGIKILKKTLHN